MQSVLISRASVRLTFLSAFFALGSFIWGYNVGILSSILVNPGFLIALHHPSASHTGLITAIYYLGTWLSYIFLSQPASDYLGRRFSALIGTFVACIGSALQAGATGHGAYAMIIGGRIISGLGLAIVSTSVPLYQSEIAPARQRGKYVVMNHIGMVTGIAIAFWVGYGVSFWDSPHGKQVGWRFSIALQYIPAAIFMAGLPFLPETPRWLVLKGKLAQGQSSLKYLRAGTYSDEETDTEFAEIKDSIEAHKASGETWTSLFTQRNLFDRLWRAALLQFMAQMCGATAMKYYLPTLFTKLGLRHRMSLMAGGIESTLKIGCTIIEMMVIDRLGRRITLIAGCVVMSFAMLINGALPIVYPHNANHASDYTCIVFIFVYSLGYSLGFGPASWVYGSEIFPQNLRARGLNFAASGGSIGSIVVAQVWPVGIQNIGSKTYFIFMAFNLVCIPIIALLYPETKGRSLEDMDELFKGGPIVERSSQHNTKTGTIVDAKELDAGSG